MTSYGSHAEIVAALGAAGLTCTGTTQSGWGSLTGLPDVTPAESTVCWIDDSQPDAPAANILILRFNTADDLASSDDEIVAQRCGSVPAGQPAPKLRAVAEGTTWVVGDSGTHGGIWGAKDEAADAPAITTTAVQIASAVGGKVLQWSC